MDDLRKYLEHLKSLGGDEFYGSICSITTFQLLAKAEEEYREMRRSAEKWMGAFKITAHELDETRNRIITEINILVADYNSSIHKLKATESGLIAANQAFSTVSERYNLGLADFTDLAESQAQLVKAKSERVQALYNMDFQTKVISYYTGLLNPTSFSGN